MPQDAKVVARPRATSTLRGLARTARIQDEHQRTRWPSILITVSCLAPMASFYLGLPDLSGAEGVLAVFAWLSIIVTTGRAYWPDAVVVGLGVWIGLSAFANGLAVQGGLLYFAFLACPFIMLRLVLSLDDRSLSGLRRTLYRLTLAQIVMLLIQFANQTGVDDLKGTFVGTQYGAHVAAFIVLISGSWYAYDHPGSTRARLFIVGGLGLAFVADSKIALGTFGIAAVAYLVMGRTPKNASAFNILGRLVLTVAAIGLGWAFYNGTLGNIGARSYLDLTLTTGGGKVAVTELIVDPGSDWWTGPRDVSHVWGAGPGQSVSRVAALSVPNPQGSAPAANAGATPSEHYYYFIRQAASRGFVGESSATAPASSLLGLLGDLGVIGLAIYLLGWWKGCRMLAGALGWRSWAAILWAVFLIPGFLGEWLEFPAATMFLAVVVGLMAKSATSLDPDVTTGR